MLKQAGVGVLAALAITCACAREAPPSGLRIPSPRHFPDAAIADHRGGRAAARHARRPASRLRLSGRIDPVGGAIGRLGLQPAPAARKPAVPAGAHARRAARGIRVPDRRRSLPAHRRARSHAAGRAGRERAALREGDRRDDDPRRDRRGPPVAHRGDGSVRRDHPARDGGGRHLQRADRLRERSAAAATRSRCCSRSRRATGSSPATARSSAPASAPTAASIRRSAGPTRTRRGRRTTTRTATRSSGSCCGRR